MRDRLKIEWQELAISFCKDEMKVESLWDEIETQYALKIRHYHNLSHLYNMFLQAESIKESIQDYNSFLFAIWYHDIIYKPSKKIMKKKVHF